MMLWAGMTAAHLIGPYFFDGPVNNASYTEMLEASLPQLRDRRLMKKVWLQHDRAPAHFVCTVCNIFQAAALAMIHQHLLRHYRGHHVALILPHRQLFAGLIKG
jgi:hypothetical protein